jgi:hypothetical protein
MKFCKFKFYSKLLLKYVYKVKSFKILLPYIIIYVY